MNFYTKLFSTIGFLLCFYPKLTAQEFKIIEGLQTAKSDSLKLKLLISHGSERLAILHELNLLYRDVKYDVALAYADEFYKGALILGDSTQIVKGGCMRAYSLVDFGRNEEALLVLLRSLGTAQRNTSKLPALKKQIGFILNYAGVAYMHLAQYDKALDVQFQALKIMEDEGDNGQILTSLNNIGLIFYNLEDYESSVKYFLKAERLGREMKESLERKKALINLGLCYTNLNNPKEAIISLEKALTICGPVGNEAMVKECEEGLGCAFYKQKELIKAKEKFLLSLEISRKQNDTRFICENLNYLARIEIDLGNDTAGAAALKYGLKLAESAKLMKSKLFAYEELSRLYKKQNDFKNSLFFLEKYNQLKDSVYSSALIKNLTKIQTDFAERENVKMIKAKDEILFLDATLIQKQKLMTMLMAAVATLLLLLASVFYKFYRDKLLINIKLARKVRERTEELRQNNNNLVHANEMQHSLLLKIAREGQSIISGIKGLCHMATVDVYDEKVKAYLQKVDDHIDKLLVLLLKSGH